MANKVLQQLMKSRTINKIKSKSLNAATPVVEDQTLQTWIKEVSSTIKDMAGSNVKKSDLVKAGIVKINNGELQNALKPSEEVNLTVPAAVVNLSANSAYSSITLEWETKPSKYFGQNTIYRSDVDDFGTATQIGSTLGDVYTDYVGNHIKAYYWVRTISKFGVEGDLAPSVHAETAIDVTYVLEQLEGHITLSQLDQILRGEISSISDISSGLQEEARLRVLELAALADQLRQESINKAQEIQDKVDGVNATIQQQIIGLTDGITTEVNSRLDGDQKNINSLEAYKLSNDNAVGAVINKVDLAISTNEVQATTIAGLQTNFETVSGKLATKADASNLTLAENKIAEVEGRVVVTTENITALGSRVSTVEDEISTKADSSVLVNYSTKTETDNAIASKIESYDANLVIGGTNIMEYTSGNAAIYGVHITYDAATNSFIKPSGAISYTAFRLDSFKPKLGEVYTVSGYLYVDDQPANYSNYWTVDSTINRFQINIGTVRVKSDGYFFGTFEVADASEWGGSHFFFPTGPLLDESLHTLRFKDVQLEKGSKPSAYSMPSYETQKSLNANANAIQTVTAEVARVNGEVVSTATNVSNLSSNVGLLQGSINEVRQTVTNNQESTNTLVTSLKSGMADADDVSMMMRNATVVYEDLNFRDGTNGIAVYNNYFNGALANNFTDKLPDNPVASTRQLQFIHSGGLISPGLGGYHQVVQTRANGVFLVKFVAKLPVGFNFELSYNVYGDGANCYFIGGNEGTGKFKTYYAVYRCGATGSFSTVGFVYVSGQWPTPENPLIWHLASSTVYDCLDSKVAPDSVVNGIAEAKSTASTAVNKAEATALIAQNIQAALDNTNADITANYYTKAQTDTVVAGKIEKFSSSVFTAGENLYKGDILHVAKAYAPGISGFNYTDYWVIDADAGNVNYIAIYLGIASETLNNNGLYAGAITVSMDYMVESGSPEALPSMFFGHGYQAFVHAQDGPHLHGKWYRIYTTFYTDANTLLFNPHFGVGGIAGRICIRNLKIERGNLTAYSVDVRETTESINGIEAVKTVTIDNNGVMSGYGLISELKNGQVTSSFGVNANTFYIGSPSLDKKPFIQRNDWSVINGVWVPPGTYIDTAYIANATISNAQIGDLSADKITTGSIAADRMKANIVAAAQGQFTSLSSISATIGVLRTSTYGARTEIKDNLIEVYDSSGKLRVRLGVWS